MSWWVWLLIVGGGVTPVAVLVYRLFFAEDREGHSG